jgi:Bacterial transcriptional activator domain
MARSREAVAGGDPAAAADLVRAGLALWRGPALRGAVGEYVTAVAPELPTLPMALIRGDCGRLRAAVPGQCTLNHAPEGSDAPRVERCTPAHASTRSRDPGPCVFSTAHRGRRA